MFKPTPNPPEADPTSPYESLDSKKLNEAADRALDYYLKPPIPKDTKRKPSTIYHVGAEVDNETLLVNCLLYTSPSPRDGLLSRMPSSA